MESMESIRGEQRAINHMMIRHAEHAFMHVRQQAVIRGCVYVFMCLRRRGSVKEIDTVNQEKDIACVYAFVLLSRRTTEKLWTTKMNGKHMTFSPVKDPSSVTDFMSRVLTKSSSLEE